MTQALSVRQQELVDRMAAAGGRIIRHPGGYWITAGTAMSPSRFGHDEVPTWYAGTQTVYACETRGLIEREHAVERGRALPSWQDPRRLTEAGWAAAKAPGA